MTDFDQEETDRLEPVRGGPHDPYEGMYLIVGLIVMVAGLGGLLVIVAFWR